jgi:four helix bundle protein
MNVAEGSLEETRYYLRLANDLGYNTDATLVAKAAEIGKMLSAYSRTLLTPNS